jgi:hypothetical protein
LAAIALPFVLFGGCVSAMLSKDTSNEPAVVVAKNARLDNGGTGDYYVFRTKQNASDFLGSVGRKDKDKALSLFVNGNVMTVPWKTQVKVLESSGTLTKIKILEGTYRNTNGWVPYEWVKK